MDFFLRNMLGLFYGRVYYNLLNWYKLTSILPGFKYNREFMETMMGTSQGLADEIADRIKPPGFQEKLSSRIRRFITGIKFLYFHFTIQGVVDRFLAHFYPIYDKYRTKDWSRMPADEIFGHYQGLERELLREWKAPIINDYLCMVHFGVFKKLTAKWLGKLGPSIQNDLLCGDGNLESAEPTRELIRMAEMVVENPSLKTLIETTPVEDCLEALQHSSHDDFKKRVASYIDRFGFRCMSEMKLEQRDLTMDPGFLFVCLKNYLKAGSPDLEAYEKREKEIRLGAEKRVRENLGGWKAVVYNWSLKHARKAVRNRENTRFCRTRVYGVVRRMFYGIGRDFAARGMIERMEEVFYLTLPELSGALEGTLTVQNLKALVDVRKAEYERFQTLEPASRFMTRGPVYWQNEHFPEEVVVADENLPPNALKGTGCCPGKIEGVVKVILSPDDNLELNGEILVTMRTDPGWIPLYPSVSGLLVERGGLLSHSAIVAREMGLPTVVGIKGLTKKLKTGMRIRFDGQSGLIEILD
jgi:rifampicin phosphotransferase